MVDELHTFRGVFGSHVAQLLRRLRRLAVHHGADPVFICSSATIGEPQRLATAVCGADVVPVLDDGSPQRPAHRRAVAAAAARRAHRRPRLGAPRGGRASWPASSTAATPRSGFARSRRGRRDRGGRRAPPAAPLAWRERVRAYRGGYLAEERRAIEDELFAGQLSGVVATSALELGIDVGGLDAVVVDGFPGTIASFWQQAGRAGRSGAASAAVLVTGNDQLDQWLATHPEELLTRAPEPAVVNPANPFVLDPHLRCAAHELPLTHADERWWPGLLDDGVRRLVQADELAVRHRGRRHEPIAVWVGTGWPQPRRRAAQRGRRAGAHRHRARASGPVGDVDRARAPEQVHAGASYLHQGQHWRVVDARPRRGRGARRARRRRHLHGAAPRHRRSGCSTVDAERPVGRALACTSAPSRCTPTVVGYQRKDALTGARGRQRAARPARLHAA